MPSWNDFTSTQKDALLARRDAGESVSALSYETGIPPNTLRGRLSEWRNQLSDYQPERQAPSNPELFAALKKGPVSLAELSRKFDRSEATIQQWVLGMQKEGYQVKAERNFVEALPASISKTFAPAKTLADQEGQELTIAWVSDEHSGSSHSQPSAIKKFVEIAYYEYGVRHILHPGDITTGIFGYKGQEWDLIPSLRPLLRSPALATRAQVWLADQYTPRLPGLKHYFIGGNHDYWHIAKSGIDAVSLFCAGRDDCYFLGYDVADVPLTDRVSVRLWHPSGGVPYSISYRVQKGLEQVAFEELEHAIQTSEDPKVRILLAGHLHVEVKFHRGPMVGIHAGCFEGQTNYLKRKGLYPTIGGGVAKIRLSDGGLIQRFNYEFIPFYEVENDWENFPVPPEMEEPGIPDTVETLFSFAG